MTDNLKIIVLIQGPIASTTPKLIEDLHDYFSADEIYYSHYDGEISLTENGVRDIFHVDPGVDKVVGQNKTTNISRMMLTTYGSGVATNEKSDLILKLRSDLTIQNLNLFRKTIDTAKRWFQKEGTAQLFVVRNGSLNPFSKYSYPFHFSDWIFITRTTRFKYMEEFYLKCKKIDPFIQPVNYQNKANTLLKYNTRYQGEQINHFFQDFEKIGMQNGKDCSEGTLLEYIRFLMDHVYVVTLRQFGIRSSKRPKGIGITQYATSVNPIDIYLLQKLSLNQGYLYLKFIGAIRRKFHYPVFQYTDRILRRLRLID